MPGGLNATVAEVLRHATLPRPRPSPLAPLALRALAGLRQKTPKNVLDARSNQQTVAADQPEQFSLNRRASKKAISSENENENENQS